LVKKPTLLGMVSVWVEPDEVMENVDVAVEVAKVWDAPVKPFREFNPPDDVPQSAPVPETIPLVSTCKHCVDPEIAEIVRLVVVVFPEIIVAPKLFVPPDWVIPPPTICNEDDGTDVPIPRNPDVLFQYKAAVLDTVDVDNQNVTRPETPVPETGGLTVQFVSPGAHPGSRVSPGLYGDVGGAAKIGITKEKNKYKKIAQATKPTIRRCLE
jgi:hypothetical protein